MTEGEVGGYVPPALAARVSEALRAHAPGADVARPSPADCLAAGEGLLGVVLHGADRGRSTALDLLAADALVTHAFELAAAEPETLERLALASMRRTAALVEAP